MKHKKVDIRSIGELIVHGGGRNLTPVFKGNMFPTLVYVTEDEFKTVRGNENLMKDLAIKKLNQN